MHKDKKQDEALARRVAKEEVKKKMSEHIAYPAPLGHKNLGKMIEMAKSLRGRHG